MAPESKADEPRVAAARAFLRSLNILLKSARMYGLDHQRTAAQYDTALRELHTALPSEGTAGLTLGVSGKQLLVDGAAVDTSPAERSFADLLSAGKLSSIHFEHHVAAAGHERAHKALEVGGAKNPQLAEQLKTALEENPQATIRVNPIRYVASEGEHGEVVPVSPVVAGSLLGMGGGGKPVDTDIQSLLGDPAKLLELIAAAEGAGSSGGSGEPGGGGGGGAGEGSGHGLGEFSRGAGEGAGSAYGGSAMGSGGTAYSSEPMELISASEAMLHAGSGPPGVVAPSVNPSSGQGTGSATGSSAGSGTAAGAGLGPGTGSGPGLGPGAGGGGLSLARPSRFVPREDDVMSVLRLLAK